MARTRRNILGFMITAGAIGLAGCSGGDEDSGAPDADTNPKELLPETPEGWTVDEEALEQGASIIGAEVGFQRTFTSERGEHYAAEVYRFPESGDDVEEAVEVFESWIAYIVRGHFGFAGDGADIDNVYMMLGKSLGLTEEYARNNNQL